MIMIHGGRDHCRNWESLNAPMPEKIHVWMDELRNLTLLIRGLESLTRDPVADGRTKNFNCDLKVESFAKAGHRVCFSCAQ